MSRYNQICLTLLLVCLCFAGICQQKDSAPPANQQPLRKHKNGIFKKAGELLLNAVTRSTGNDSTVALLNLKVEDPYLPYKDKIIRSIYIKQLGFENPINDTTHRINYFGTRLLNSTHRTTRSWVIRNNLFIHPGDAVSVIKMADNERFLRTLNFIQDARIIIKPIANEEDSVDVEVITKDLFTIQFDLSEASTERVKGKIGDANAFGAGQLMQVRYLFDKQRNPGSGFEFLYTKRGIGNSFVNATLAYSRINNNLQDGRQNDNGWRIILERPLYSQYAHLTGAVQLGINQSNNDYEQPDSLFYKYRYRIVDGWLGYNLKTGINELDRQLVSARYMNMPFENIPDQIGNKYSERFNSKKMMIGSYTFFRQLFYKTNYLYGFGTTEDVPYGYNVSLTGGWYEQNGLGRAYAGIDANRYIVTPTGNIIQYFLRTGGFVHESSLQDASILGGASLYSRLMLLNGMKIRQYIRLSATRQFDRVTFDPLRIDNAFGIRYFSSDSVTGSRRISLHSETNAYLKYKLFGFKFSVFLSGDASYITPEQEAFKKSDLYYFIGGGIRTRNENFVFGTIEMRAIYYPKVLPYTNQFKIVINSNLNFRATFNYIKAPGIIQLNNDDGNNIY